MSKTAGPVPLLIYDSYFRAMPNFLFFAQINFARCTKIFWFGFCSREKPDKPLIDFRDGLGVPSNDFIMMIFDNFYWPFSAQ